MTRERKRDSSRVELLVDVGFLLDWLCVVEIHSAAVSRPAIISKCVFSEKEREREREEERLFS